MVLRLEGIGGVGLLKLDAKNPSLESPTSCSSLVLISMQNRGRMAVER
jgi:hypothetical protein